MGRPLGVKDSYKRAAKQKVEPTISKQCLTCSATFLAYSWGKYCSPRCKEMNARNRKGPEYARNANLKKKYNLTLDEWETMFDAQGRVCAMCGTDTPAGRGWQTDHDHKCCSGRANSCGKCIRGILCHPCNIALGALGDSAENALNAALYLLRGEAE